MKFEMLPIDLERHNQFATKARAQYFALAETARTGRRHHVTLTHTNRGYDTYQCYTAVKCARAVTGCEQSGSAG